jgi:hypothetical protein
MGDDGAVAFLLDDSERKRTGPTRCLSSPRVIDSFQKRDLQQWYPPHKLDRGWSGFLAAIGPQSGAKLAISPCACIGARVGNGRKTKQKHRT